MAKTKKKKRAQPELDSVYFLKLVMYLVIGTFWLRVGSPSNTIPIPVGLGVGLILAAHDHFKIDRKIEFAVLLVAMLVGFWAQIGLILTF